MVITRATTLWVPMLLLVMLLTITELVHFGQQTLVLTQQQSELVTRANDARAVLERELYPATYVAEGLSSYIINLQGNVNNSEVLGWLAILYDEAKYLRNIGLAPDNRIELVYPVAENQAVLGLYYPEIPAQWPVVQAVMAAREPLLQGPISLIQGGQGLIYRIPVFIDDQYWGLVSTVIDADRLFGVLAEYSEQSLLSIALSDTRSGVTGTYFWQSDRALAENTASVPIELQGVAWQLSVSYGPEVNALNHGLRIAGWLIAVGFAVVMFLLLNSIKSRRLVQNRLAENEERLQSILDGTNIGTWEWNVQTGETRFNERWADIVGYSLAELAPVSIDTWTQLAHPEDLAESGERLQRHFAGELPFYDVQCRMKHKKGHWVWVHARGRVMTWTENGLPSMMFGTHSDVTEQVNAREGLQAQKDLLRAIIDNIPINVYIKDRTGKKLMANRAERIFMGLDPDTDDIGLHDSQFLPADLARISSDEDHRVFETGEPIMAAEYDSRGPDGLPRWQLVSKIPFTNDAGQVHQLLGITVDITERKAAEDALQVSRDQFFSLVENIPGMSYRCLLDDDWTMLYISSQVDAISGYPSSDFIDNAVRSYASVLDAEDNENNWQTVMAAIAERRSWEIKYRVHHRDGSIKWAYEKGRAVVNDDGEVVCLDGFVLDITDQVQAEIALKDSESRLRALFEMSPVGIALNDYESGVFLDVNDALLASCGYTRSAFLNLSYWQVTPEEYQAQETAASESLLTTGRYGPLEKEYIDCNGERYPVRLNGVMIEDRTGKKLIWSIIEDIRESKRVERLKREFVSTVSHELRTPLTAISGSLGLVREGVLGALPHDALEMVAMAHDSSQRLTLLINDLLDMDKLIAGKMNVALTAVDASALVARAIRENQPYADQYGVQLQYESPEEPVWIKADEQRLMQVMNNLLSNAAKFTADNTTVEVSLAHIHRRIRINVRDHGPGITAEFEDKVFTQFSQADGSDTRRRGGTGLGLAISKQLVELMQGCIGYETALGEGTCFYIEIPESERMLESSAKNSAVISKDS